MARSEPVDLAKGASGSKFVNDGPVFLLELLTIVGLGIVDWHVTAARTGVYT
jgi:hypothetical protein